MKKLILVNLAIALMATCLSAQSNDEKDKHIDNEKASSFFRRQAVSAHPLPDPDFVIDKRQPDIPLSGQPSTPIFLNSNLIETELTANNPIQNESSIAVNFTNPKNLIASAVDYRDTSATWVYVSSDGGRKWINKKLGRPYPGWLSSNDPSVAFSTSGTGYLVYGGFGVINDTSKVMFGENGVFFARSTDQGKTWQAHIPIIVHKGQQTLDSTFEDKYYIQVDNSPASPYFNDLYVPWKRVTPRDSATQIVISKSTDMGSSWSVPVAVSPRLSGSSEDTTYGQSFPLSITGPGGEVYVIWNNGIEHGVGFAKSLDGGKTFSQPRIIQKYNIFGVTRFLEGQDAWRHSLKVKVRAETYPSMVCDLTNGPRRGNLYLTWAADQVPNIYFSRSTDMGESWSNPVIIHSDPANDQFWQWISLDPTNGDLAVMYLDSRNDPANIRVECFVAYSSDGGLTWIDRRASDINSDLRKNPFKGNSFAGDYSGNAFYDGMIYPSWVDMRNAETNSLDDDVYTAVVNTRAPNPAEDFKAIIIADRPAEIDLSWKAPTETTFGKSLNASDFKYVLQRDGAIIAEIPGAETAYTDKALTPHIQYHYSLLAVAVSDSSLAVIDSAYAGGARSPGAAVVLSVKGSSDNSTSIFVRMPSFRADNQTILANLKAVNIFRDSLRITTVEVQPSDAGKVIELIDKPAEKGYYTYSVTVSDGESPSNESRMSNFLTAFTGPVDNLFEEKFDSPVTAKYINQGNWAPTDKFASSPVYSLTESPKGNYASDMNYTFTLFPVKNSGTPSMQIQFRHAVIVEKRDSAYVEVSQDMGASWTALSEFNKMQFEPWQDKTLTAEDWKPETLTIGSKTGDTLVFRFRLVTNALVVDDGWYIDDIKISGSTPVDESVDGAAGFSVYPNPSSGRLFIHLDNPDAVLTGNLSVYNLYGTQALNINPELEGRHDISLDISSLVQGVYLLRFTTAGGVKKEAMFSVVR